MLLATHSPVLAALPDALIYELDGDGFTARQWAELDLVQDWQAFFDDPAGCCPTCWTDRPDRPPSLDRMDTLLTALHVVAAVFIIGPMAILPMTAMRAVRAGSGPVVAVLARATRVFTLASLVVALLGFAVLGSIAKTDQVSVTTGWVLTSIVLYLVALGLSLFVVVPSLESAGAALVTGGADAAKAVYGRIAASSGIVALLLVAVTVLMVWRP